MPSESERVTIRIPPDKIKALHQLVKSGDFTTISDAIRAAIDRFIDVKFAPDYIRKLMIELPKGNVVDLQQLVKSATPSPSRTRSATRSGSMSGVGSTR